MNKALPRSSLLLGVPLLPPLMHPTQVAQPFHTKGWVYEDKIDGWRMLAIKDAGRVRLVSRNARDHTKRFPGLRATSAKGNSSHFSARNAGLRSTPLRGPKTKQRDSASKSACD